MIGTEYSATCSLADYEKPSSCVITIFATSFECVGVEYSNGLVRSLVALCLGVLFRVCG